MPFFRREGLEKNHKGDGSPVTAADLASDRIIHEGLKATGWPVLSEEQPVAWSIRQKWSTFWLVDPLDGTKDFIAGREEFTVNIALVHGGQPVWGVIYAPAKDQLYWGGPERGAFNSSGVLQVHAAERPRRGLESHFHARAANQSFFTDNDVSVVDKVGSSLKFCRIAEGQADVYPRFGPTCEWDTGAGQAILLGAGGQVLAASDRQPLNYQREEVINPSFIAFNPFFEWVF